MRLLSSHFRLPNRLCKQKSIVDLVLTDSQLRVNILKVDGVGLLKIESVDILQRL